MDHAGVLLEGLDGFELLLQFDGDRPIRNSFGALDDTEADDASDEKDADIPTLDTNFTSLMNTLFAKMDDRFAKMDDRFAALNSSMDKRDVLFAKMDDRFAKMDDCLTELTLSMDEREQRHVASMSQMEARLLATIDVSNGKLGDLRRDVNDHERQLFHLKSDVTDHNKCLSDLNSDLLTQDSLLKGYRTTNNYTVATLRTDVNDTRARIPELRREIQDSVASLKAIEVLVFRQ